MLGVGILLAAEADQSCFSTHPAPCSHVPERRRQQHLPSASWGFRLQGKGWGDPAWSVGAWAGLRTPTQKGHLTQGVRATQGEGRVLVGWSSAGCQSPSGWRAHLCRTAAYFRDQSLSEVSRVSAQGGDKIGLIQEDWSDK